MTDIKETRQADRVSAKRCRLYNGSQSYDVRDARCPADEWTSLDALSAPIFRICPSDAGRKNADWGTAGGMIVQLPGQTSCEFEFLLPSHLLICFPDGSQRGYEIGDGKDKKVFGPAGPGAMVFNPADNYLYIRKSTKDPCRVLVVSIDPAVVRRFADFDPPQVQFRRACNFYDAGMRRTVSALQEEIESPRADGEVYRQMLVVLLMAQLVGCASNICGERGATYAKGGLPDWRLKRALEMLDSGVQKAPTLSALAAAVGLHPTSFCRAFKLSMGVSAHRYLLEKRIALAKSMMLESSSTLTKIAFDCGFSSSSQFSVTFKRIAGIAPRAYRHRVESNSLQADGHE